MARPVPDFLPVITAIADGGHPGPVFAALDAAMGQAIGHKLFTILVIHPGAPDVQRAYSNRPADYPLGGRKPIIATPWFHRLLDAGLPHIGRNDADIAEVFYDHALIRSLGCGSVLSVPVRWDGASIAIISLLHAAGWYDAADIPTAQQFAELAVPGVLGVISGA